MIARRYSCRIAIAVFALGAGSCARDIPVVETKGECAQVYNAAVCLWSRMQGDRVVEVGADVPLAVVENAAADHEMSWPPVARAILPLAPAASKQTGLTHLTTYWEAEGHPPGPYLTPHFDFHFYTVPPAERTAMDCKDLSKPAALAAGYALPDVTLPPPMAAMTGVPTLIGLCVPQMGMHSLLASEMQSTALFRGTMVIGYYKGKSIFIEPMLTRAMLMEMKSFDLAIPSIPGMTGVYPHTFHATYDAQSKSYRFAFSGFAPG